eukprot:12405806-Karenia_brevis.AAC.1
MVIDGGDGDDDDDNDDDDHSDEVMMVTMMVVMMVMIPKLDSRSLRKGWSVAACGTMDYDYSSERQQLLSRIRQLEMQEMKFCPQTLLISTWRGRRGSSHLWYKLFLVPGGEGRGFKTLGFGTKLTAGPLVARRGHLASRSGVLRFGQPPVGAGFG